MNINLHCYCSKPILITESKINCTKCNSAYHTSCIKETSDNWQCTTCTIKTKGASWAEGEIYNSCTVDNQFTLHTELALRNESHLALFNSNNVGNKVFLEALQHSMKGDYVTAKQLWANHLGTSDLFGNPDEMFTSKIEVCKNFYKSRFCDNNECKKQCYSYTYDQVYLPANIKEPQDSVHSVITYASFIECKTCANDGKVGVQEVSPLKVEDSNNPPPFLELNNTLRKFNFDEV